MHKTFTKKRQLYHKLMKSSQDYSIQAKELHSGSELYEIKAGDKNPPVILSLGYNYHSIIISTIKNERYRIYILQPVIYSQAR